MSEDRPVAQWYVQLYCDCPKCGKFVDLLTADDFWDGVSFEIGEHGTERTTEVGVVCPKCGHAFSVDLEY
jgi:Zn finger protein HypA/HybF involved in hydrogenase expression